MTAIAALNSGSSSIKFALYTLGEAQESQLCARGKLERIGEAPALRVVDGQGAPLMAQEWPDGAGMTHADLLGQLFEWAQSHLDRRQLIGIGENSAAVRARIIARLGWLGARLDESANHTHAPIISAPDSALTLRIIPTDEEKMIALQTLSVLKGLHP